MPFPEWGRSYNALCVPLIRAWQCALIPVRDIEDVDRGWRLSYEEHQKARKEREVQMEQDKRDFDCLFRVSIARSASRNSGDFSAYAGFIREHVRGAWHTPIDGEDITRILREAVRDGLIVPAIDRNWRGRDGVSKRYAPQAWPKRTPDPKPTVYASRNGRFYPMDPFGNVLDERYYAFVGARAAASASNADSSGRGFDWLGAAAAVDVAAFGGMDSDDENNGNSMLRSFGSSRSDGSLLGDAHPFEYQPDMPDGDTYEVAGIPNMTGDPNSWIESGPGMKKQWRMFGPNGAATVDIDFDSHHGQPNPHAHNWDGTSRDQGWPVSILP